MSEYVTVEEAANEAMADLIKQRLAEAGIACVVVPSDLAALAGAGASYALGPRREGRRGQGTPRRVKPARGVAMLAWATLALGLRR